MKPDLLPKFETFGCRSAVHVRGAATSPPHLGNDEKDLPIDPLPSNRYSTPRDAICCPGFAIQLDSCHRF